MEDWADLVAFALNLPGVVIASHYGHPVPKKNGRAIVAPGREAGSFCLMVSTDEKQLLLDTDPDTFWQTDHYRNYPAILVRYGRSRARVETGVRRSWWDLCSPPERRAHGPRP
ncbi:hypothetical protein [Sphingomonas sp.]|uniref:hypothetical protein n=1 Tax=Sphingomonas sp. TaxID=28214 RepID=UPI001ECCBF46|nr:hypothetical protein [Sphingomonas sp.]MBX3593807.1 hypothetical protein [Sphingomonas sp.]